MRTDQELFNKAVAYQKRADKLAAKIKKLQELHEQLEDKASTYFFGTGAAIKLGGSIQFAY